MDNISYLIVAYAVVWVVLFLYLFSIASREKKIRRELEDLARMVSRTSR